VSWLVVCPILIPLVGAASTALLRGSLPAQRIVTIATMALLTAACAALLWRVNQGGVVALQLSNWEAPFGITLAADHLSALLALAAAVVGLCIAVFAPADLEREREAGGFHPVFNALLVGVGGAFVTGDLFNMYVWFEVMLISSFVLLSLGGTREQTDGALKYAGINLVATVLLLLAVALLYALTGTLNMADLSIRLKDVENQGMVSTVAVLFIIAFGIKAALFPLFFWLPAAYHTPATAVQAVLAGLLTKVGVYALLRSFTLLFTGDEGYTHGVLLGLAGFTMAAGALGALAMGDIRRVLGFQVVATIGLMVMGVALNTPLALAGCVFYLVHDMLLKTGLFLGAGVARRLSGGTALAGMGGLYAATPLLSLLMFALLASLAGFPPFSGFWGKLALVRAALEAEAWVMAGVALAMGLLTMWLVGRVWGEMFWKARPAGDAPGLASLPAAGRAALVGPVALLALATLAIGLWPAPLMEISARAAAELSDPAAYIQTVLGAREGGAQ